MFTKTHCLSIVLLIFLASCKTDYSEGPGIKDFRQELRPYLTTIVARGTISFGFINPTLDTMLTDKELIQLSKSEHPILRIRAFMIMKNKKSFNYMEYLMDHLDDTAHVIIDFGKFDIRNKMVADIILEDATWKNFAEKSRTIDKVITKHNYLQFAYNILPRIKVQEKYFPFIRDMVIRRRNYDEDRGEQGFEDIEQAMYALAKFKKKEDVKLIRGILLSNYTSMTQLSFLLMRTFPDTSYLDVFERYFPGHYYSSYPREKIYELARPFTSALAIYKNERSARILDSILNGRQACWVPITNSGTRNNLLYEIWNNPCEAYTELRNQIADEVQRNGLDKKDYSADFWTPKLLDSSATNTAWFQ